DLANRLSGKIADCLRWVIEQDLRARRKYVVIANHPSLAGQSVRREYLIASALHNSDVVTHRSHVGIAGSEEFSDSLGRLLRQPAKFADDYKPVGCQRRRPDCKGVGKADVVYRTFAPEQVDVAEVGGNVLHVHALRLHEGIDACFPGAPI